MIINSLQNYTEKESASKFLKAFESYQNRTKNEIGALEHLCLKAYQEIVVPKSYLTCFRHFVGIYNGQDTANIVCEGKKIFKKSRMALVCPSSTSPSLSIKLQQRNETTSQPVIFLFLSFLYQMLHFFYIKRITFYHLRFEEIR